jgi:hypothetical protein
MASICSGFECSTFEEGGNNDIDVSNFNGDKEKFIYCKKICEEEDNAREINRNLNIDNEFRALNSDLSKRQNEMSTTDQFVKDTTQLWRFEKNKFIFLIICLILISLCALYMVYKTRSRLLID